MIKSIHITNERGDSLDLVLGESNDAKIVIVNIDGLSPPKAIINTLGGITFDGSRYNSSKVGNRNILMTLAIVGSPEDSYRKSIYKVLPIKKEVRIRVVTDIDDVYTYGRVEANEVKMFNKIEHTEISILCPYPYFKSTVMGETVLSGVVGSFYFPFSNNSLSQKLLSFGTVTNYVSRNIDYEGVDETGVEFVFRVLGPISGTLVVHNATYNQRSIIDLNTVTTIIDSELQFSDYIIIDSRLGQKGVFHMRQNVVTNILNALIITSDWITLNTGNNTIVYEVSTNRDNITAIVNYDILIEGV